MSKLVPKAEIKNSKVLESLYRWLNRELGELFFYPWYVQKDFEDRAVIVYFYCNDRSRLLYGFSRIYFPISYWLQPQNASEMLLEYNFQFPEFYIMSYTDYDHLYISGPKSQALGTGKIKYDLFLVLTCLKDVFKTFISALCC